MLKPAAAIAVLLLATACSDDPVEVEFEVARRAGEEAGFADGQRKGFEAGLAEGQERGFARGRKEGRAAALMRWTPVGVGVGALLGFGVLLWIRRETIAKARAERDRQAALTAAFGRLPTGLDAASRARLESILTQRQALDRAFATATTPAAIDLKAHLQPRLDRLGETIVELSALTARLRAALRDTPVADVAAIKAREAELADETDPQLRAALESSIAAQRRVIDARTRAETGLKRCEVQLEAIEAFLGHARMSVAAAQIDPGDAVSELGAEVEAITEAVRVARAELAAI